MAFSIPTTGIQLNVDFDDDCTDDSPNALTMTPTGDTYAAGVIDQALSTSGLFTGVYIEDPDPAITLEAIDQTIWFRFKYVGTVGSEINQLLFTLGLSPRMECAVETSGSNSNFKYRFFVENNSGGDELDAEIAGDNNWHSVLFEWTNASSNLRCVVDGVEIFSGEHPAGVDDIIGDTELDYPANDSGLLTSFLIDHACVWNRTLSAGEISGLMETPTTPPAASSISRAHLGLSAGL